MGQHLGPARPEPASLSEASDRPGAVWQLWRQDDAGNRHLMRDRLTEAAARALSAAYEARGHKQTYWAERAGV